MLSYFIEFLYLWFLFWIYLKTIRFAGVLYLEYVCHHTILIVSFEIVKRLHWKGFLQSIPSIWIYLTPIVQTLELANRLSPRTQSKSSIARNGASLIGISHVHLGALFAKGIAAQPVTLIKRHSALRFINMKNNAECCLLLGAWPRLPWHVSGLPNLRACRAAKLQFSKRAGQSVYQHWANWKPSWRKPPIKCTSSQSQSGNPFCQFDLSKPPASRSVLRGAQLGHHSAGPMQFVQLWSTATTTRV